LIILGVMLISAAAMSQSAIAIALAIALVVVAAVSLALVQSALQGIYAAAIYRYAQEGAAGAGFDQTLVASAFKTKADSGFFRNRSFTGAQIGAFAISGSMFALFLYITLYVQNIIGKDALTTGLIYLPSTLLTFFISGATASLMTRAPLRVLLGSGLAITGIGLIVMSGRVEGDDWTALLPGFLIIGFGVGLINPVLANIALSTVPDEQSGVAAGINDTFRQVGISTAVAGLGALLLARATDHIQSALALGHHQARLLAEGVSSGALDPHVPHQIVAVARQGFLDGFNAILIVGAILALVGAVLTTLLVRASDLIVSEPVI